MFVFTRASIPCYKVSTNLCFEETLASMALDPDRVVQSKVCGSFHEHTLDILNTNVRFSIPHDALPTITTDLVRFQWLLRFEFSAGGTPATNSTVPQRQQSQWHVPVVVNPAVATARNQLSNVPHKLYSVDLKYAANRANETVTLVSLEREWLEQHLNVNAAMIDTFLTLLALETQSDRAQETEQQSKCRVRVTLEPLSMSRCTLQLLDAHTKTLAPRSGVKLLFEAVQRKELRPAHLTQHTNGYLSSWEVEFHLQEAAQWYASTRGRSESNEASASTVRRLLQELRGAQQRG
ncbi:hypothetical protein PsorP6_013564 [Peronosclerospora sorghi]|uniref:Uncharacterized protein n=1 Tax=Peronosclerospora sorghi TaxID=230839 RepID=A0ACC0VGA4_9STRA|nr:hypothetical protein PsorP6_013564 [Peronosclerospora sorghi]